MSTPSEDRSETVIEGLTIEQARLALYTIGARMKTSLGAVDVEHDLWITPDGELCEGLRWTLHHPDEVEYTAHIPHR
ncbi:MAG: hypothetical protein FGM29_03115 [Actinobacteria bacterium]|nr:hypothetical protein [Actinomycetota bacterium]